VTGEMLARAVVSGKVTSRYGCHAGTLSKRRAGAKPFPLVLPKAEHHGLSSIAGNIPFELRLMPRGVDASGRAGTVRKSSALSRARPDSAVAGAKNTWWRWKIFECWLCALEMKKGSGESSGREASGLSVEFQAALLRGYGKRASVKSPPPLRIAPRRDQSNSLPKLRKNTRAPKTFCSAPPRLSNRFRLTRRRFRPFAQNDRAMRESTPTRP
jgi:hypothetical protein